MELIKRIAIALFLITLLNGCLVSRTERPLVTGFVFDDETKQPIEGCKVGDTFTDVRGFYTLKEKRYREFTLPGFEARPVLVVEHVKKEGYIPGIIEGYNPYGGGLRKGAHWEMDTVYLKESPPDILNNK